MYESLLPTSSRTSSQNSVYTSSSFFGSGVVSISRSILLQHRSERSFVDHFHAQLFRFIKFRTGLDPGHDEIRFLADRSRDPAAVRLDQGTSFVARHTRKRAGQDEYLAREPLISGWARLILGLCPDTGGAQTVAQTFVPRIVEPVTDALRHRQTDLVNLVQLFDRRFGQALQRSEMPRQDAGRAFANVSNAEAVNQMPEVARLTRLDLPEHVRCGFLRHPFQRRQVIQFQAVKIGDVFHDLLRNQLIDERKAQALDTHRAAGSEMQ